MLGKIANALAKVLRVLSIPPVLALCLLLALFYGVPGFFATRAHFFVAVACLTVVPTLAYPVSWLIRKGPEERRKAQRWLAIFFTMAGYAFVAVYALCDHATNRELVLYLTYAISVLLIALTSLTKKWRASGHACGIAGPVVAASYMISPWCLFAFLLLPFVFWSSLRLKRHRVGELVLGSLIPVVAFLILAWIYKI